MARYISDFTMEQNQQDFFNRAHELLTGMGYSYVTYKGENVFKKGSGWVSAPTFFKISYFGTTVRIEAWLKTALLPGVYCGEHGIDGFYGWAVKDVLKGRVGQLEQLLMSMGGVPLGNPVYIAQPAPPTVPVQPQAPQNGVICPVCGKVLPNGSAFCSNCGSAQR